MNMICDKARIITVNGKTSYNIVLDSESLAR